MNAVTMNFGFRITYLHSIRIWKFLQPDSLAVSIVSADNLQINKYTYKIIGHLRNSFSMELKDDELITGSFDA
jgi:hypothetical protein